MTNTTEQTNSTDVIDLYMGYPSDNLLPTDAIVTATQSMLSKPYNEKDLDECHPLAYGPQAGNHGVRSNLAAWSPDAFKESLFVDACLQNSKKTDRIALPGSTSMSASWESISQPIDPNSINMTNGASFGAMNILTQLTLPYPRSGSKARTRRGFILSPTYFMINSIFMDAGFAGKIDAIKQDIHSGSVDLVTLEEKLEYYSQQQVDPVDEPQLKAYESQHPDHYATSFNHGVHASFVHDPVRPEPRKIFSFVIYLIPTYCNPTGSTMSLGDRVKLIELARKYDMLILSDDVYDLVDYREKKLGMGVKGFPVTPEVDEHGQINIDTLLPPRIVTLDRWTLCADNAIGNTISNNSFSKLLSPGLRVGWQETATPYLAQKQLANSGAIRSAGTPSHYTTNLVGELLSLGLVTPIIKRLTDVYASRVSMVLGAVERYLPVGTKVYGGHGGYFVWIELPITHQYLDKQISADLVAQKGEEMYKILFAAGSAFKIDGDERPLGLNCFRISISRLEGQVIVDCLKKLGLILNGLLDGSIPV